MLSAWNPGLRYENPKFSSVAERQSLLLSTSYAHLTLLHQLTFSHSPRSPKLGLYRLNLPLAGPAPLPPPGCWFISCHQPWLMHSTLNGSLNSHCKMGTWPRLKPGWWLHPVGHSQLLLSLKGSLFPSPSQATLSIQTHSPLLPTPPSPQKPKLAPLGTSQGSMHPSSREHAPPLPKDEREQGNMGIDYKK